MRFLNGPTSLPALLSCDFARKGVEVGPLCKGMLAFPYSLYRKTGANPHRPEEKGGNSTHLPNQGVFWRDSATHNATMQPFCCAKGYAKDKNLSVCANGCLSFFVLWLSATGQAIMINNNVKISLIVNNLPALHHCTKHYCGVTLTGYIPGNVACKWSFQLLQIPSWSLLMLTFMCFMYYGHWGGK